MKAYVLHGINDLRYDDIEMPQLPSKDWAIVKVKAAGICSSDIARVYTKGTYHFPTIPGHEFAGVVYSVGDSLYDYLIGKKVGIFPLIPCKKCEQCINKHYEMCCDYDYLGSRRNGGFAEFVAVPIWNLILLPDNISYSSAAMLEPLAVGIHAAKLGEIEKDNAVAIIGTGMIGISAAQCISIDTDNVTIIGRNESKRKIVEKCGLNYEICTIKDNMKQYDVIIEAVGSISAIEMAIIGVKPGGTIVFMGNPMGDITLKQDIYWKILRKQLKIKGSWNSSYDYTNPSDWTTAVNLIATNKINIEPLISHSFSQDSLKDGLNLMREHIEPYCKVMTLWNELK